MLITFLLWNKNTLHGIIWNVSLQKATKCQFCIFHSLFYIHGCGYFSPLLGTVCVHLISVFFYFPSYFFFSIKYIFYNSMALIAFIYMLFQELRTKMIKEKVNVVETAKDSSIVSLSVFLIYSRNVNQNRPLVAEIISLKFYLFLDSHPLLNYIQLG